MTAPANPLSAVSDPGRLRDLLDAVLAVGSDLALPHVLKNIVTTATKLCGARYGALGVLSVDGSHLSEFVNVGIPPDEALAIGRLPQGHGVLGLLIVDPRPLRVADVTAHPDRAGFPPNHPPMHSFLGVPIRIRGEVFGNLYLAEKATTTEFSEEDETLAVALGAAAAIAIDNARLHARVRDLAMVEDRERIAADLHDTVIQRLFATGLSLQGIQRVVSPPAASERVAGAVTALDETIRQIRATIFALQAPRVAGRTLRAEILALAAEAAASLRFDPHLRLDGPIDAVASDELVGHVVAVIREALTNVVRHAGATRVDIVVSVHDGTLTAEVRDDGVGMPDPPHRPGSGLANMRRRAEGMGGSLTLGAAPSRGTVLTWSVPLP